MTEDAIHSPTDPNDPRFDPDAAMLDLPADQQARYEQQRRRALECFNAILRAIFIDITQRRNNAKKEESL